MELESGDLVDGKYRVVRALGRGGMGAVYEAVHERLRRRVALKLIVGALTEGARDRFMREARASAQLLHPHSVSVHDVGQAADGTPYMVLELVEGETLEELHRRRALSPGNLVRVGAQVASALAAAHDVGVVHRDVKPANIMVQGAPHHCIAKVLDFGVSKILQESPPDSTLNSGVVGTPRYWAPETLLLQPCGPPVDAFSLGVVLYYLLSGRYPFAESPQTPYLLAVTVAPPIPLSRVLVGVPRAIEEAIMRCLERDPLARPHLHELASTFAAVTDFATQAMPDEAPLTIQPSDPTASRRR